MSNTIFASGLAWQQYFCCCSFTLGFLNLRRRQSSQVELGELIPSFLPVDMEILSELIDPAKQRHLQETYGRDELAENPA